MKHRKFMILLFLFILYMLLPVTVFGAVVEIPVEYSVESDLDVQIVSCPSLVTVNSLIDLVAEVKNVGNTNLTDVWLAWELPNGFEITSGEANVSFDTLEPNSTGSNAITVRASPTTGDKIVKSVAGCSEGASNADSCTITVISCGNGICEEGEDCSNCPSDCGTCPTGGTGGGAGGAGGGAAPLPPPTGGQAILTYIMDSTITTYRNTTVSSRLKIKNDGDDDLTNVTITIYDLLNNWFDYSPKYIDRIVPTETRIVEIKFTPREVGRYPFRIKIVSNEASETVTSVLVVKELTVEEIEKREEQQAVEEMIERAEEVGRIIKPWLVIIGVIAPMIVSAYMLFFLLLKRCPLCGARMKLVQEHGRIVGFSCPACGHFEVKK